eukprot:6354554-Pyramimonas_sp.AAC.1
MGRLARLQTRSKELSRPISLVPPLGLGSRARIVANLSGGHCRRCSQSVNTNETVSKAMSDSWSSCLGCRPVCPTAVFAGKVYNTSRKLATVIGSKSSQFSAPSGRATSRN